MKIRKKQLEELKKILDSDRYKGENEFNTLFQKDLISLLNDYFVFDEKPIINIENINNSINIDINFRVREVKKFGIVP